jgi:orotate phosphoribosyltransferase
MTLIEALRRAGVVRHGRFVLKSGARSNVYIDMKKAWGNPVLLRMIARAMARRLPKSATCIAVSGYGGLPLGTAVSLASNLPLTLVRETPKNHGRRTWLDGYLPTARDRVAVLDDVYTSGTGLRQIVRVIRQTRARVAGRLVVVDRSQRPRSDVTALVQLQTLL